MQGLGLWIWIIEECFGGDVTRIVAEAKAAGARRIVVKHYDYTVNKTGLYNKIPSQPALLVQLSAACRAAGIEFWVWYYPYMWGGQPEVEASIAVALAKDLDAFGIIIDAEEPWRWKEYYRDPDTGKVIVSVGESAADEVAKRSWAKRHVAYVNTNFHGPVALSSYRNPAPRYTNNFPWRETVEGVDYVTPQQYFIQGHNPKFDLERSIAQWNTIGYPYQSPKFIPTWPSFQERGWAPTPNDIVQCYETTLAHGFLGCDFWTMDWASKNPPIWAAIRDNNPWKAQQPVPPLPEPEPSHDEKVEIIWAEAKEKGWKLKRHSD
jgi:hypothetical protein